MPSDSNNKNSGSKNSQLTGKVRLPGDGEPAASVIDVFKAQFENYTSLKKTKRLPKQCEVLIVGGGIVGSFVAYWMKMYAPQATVVVVERDPMYSKSSTFMSVGGVRQQFSLPENIKMSMFGAEFLRDLQKHLACGPDDKVDLQFNTDGYLFLANKNSAPRLYENHKIQLSQDAKVRLLDKEQLKQTFRWINPDDIELGSFGYLNEGWVDARKYLLAVRNKATYLETEYIKGQIVGFENKSDAINMSNSARNVALVDTFDGNILPIRYNTVVNAAGPWAAEVARMAGIGVEPRTAVEGGGGKYGEEEGMAIGLPVEPRKRYIYLFYAANGPILNVPLTIDPSGVFFKRHGLSNYYVCGRNQASGDEEPVNMDLEHIDYEYFESKIKPVLEARVPVFGGGNIKLVNAWSGYYEYNWLDSNLIVGRHPIQNNHIFANGSSGHGLQHAAAIGRAISELVLHGEYKTIDLKRFGFERVMGLRPVKEIDVV